MTRPRALRRGFLPLRRWGGMILALGVSAGLIAAGLAATAGPGLRLSQRGVLTSTAIERAITLPPRRAVAEVLVRDGARVAADQALLRYDTQALQAELADIRLNLAEIARARDCALAWPNPPPDMPEPLHRLGHLVCALGGDADYSDLTALRAEREAYYALGRGFADAGHTSDSSRVLSALSWVEGVRADARAKAYIKEIGVERHALAARLSRGVPVLLRRQAALIATLKDPFLRAPATGQVTSLRAEAGQGPYFQAQALMTLQPDTTEAGFLLSVSTDVVDLAQADRITLEWIDPLRGTKRAPVTVVSDTDGYAVTPDSIPETLTHLPPGGRIEVQVISQAPPLPQRALARLQAELSGLNP